MKNGPEKGRSLMEQSALTAVIKDQSRRAFWEVKNVIDCIPDGLWEREYCCAPLWKHVYHMLHSLDLWMINPRDKEFSEPEFHEKDLNDLDAVSRKTLSRKELEAYFFGIERKLARYLEELTDQVYPDPGPISSSSQPYGNDHGISDCGYRKVAQSFGAGRSFSGRGVRQILLIGINFIL